MKKNRKLFGALWAVVALFCFGMALIFVAAFTTHATDFSGLADLHLKFEKERHESLSVVISDAEKHEIKPDASGFYLLHPKFESRDTNVFDTFGGGPHPRTAIVSFFEDQTKHHEIVFTYDRHGHVWQGEVAFPDPTISAVDVEKSSFEFRQMDGLRRRYGSSIFARALIGPPIIKND